MWGTTAPCFLVRVGPSTPWSPPAKHGGRPTCRGRPGRSKSPATGASRHRPTAAGRSAGTAWPTGSICSPLFAHPDGRRWLAWSPLGYYDASPGADNLAGWHLNRGADAAAAFYPLSRFASRFYRPEVVAGIIRHADVEVALAEAGKGGRKILPDADIAQLLPPEIVIISPSNGQEVSSGRIRVRYRVSAPRAGRLPP